MRALSPPALTDGSELPPRTVRALESLDDRALDPAIVAGELDQWRELVALPTAVLSAPHNDWAEFVGPSARATLEEAVRALNRRDGAYLRAELRRLDAEFARKTSNNPLADPSLPWWARRFWH